MFYIHFRFTGFWLGIEADSSSAGAAWRWDDGSDVTYPLPWNWEQPAAGLHAVIQELGFWTVVAQGQAFATLCETEVEGECLKTLGSEWGLFDGFWYNNKLGTQSLYWSRWNSFEDAVLLSEVYQA